MSTTGCWTADSSFLGRSGKLVLTETRLQPTTTPVAGYSKAYELPRLLVECVRGVPPHRLDIK